LRDHTRIDTNQI